MHLRSILSDLGCDPEQTYFDVPRLRSSTSEQYLTSGIAYAWHPHRDTWYSAPLCQLNWWLPVYEIRPTTAWRFTRTTGIGRCPMTLPAITTTYGIKCIVAPRLRA